MKMIDENLKYMPLPGDKIIIHTLNGNRLTNRERNVWTVTGSDSTGYIHVTRKIKHKRKDA